MDKNDVLEIIKRLDAVIALLVVTLPSPENPRGLRDQIQLLDNAGLGQTAIARIVRRPPKAVASELARIRARLRKKKGK